MDFFINLTTGGTNGPTLNELEEREKKKKEDFLRKSEQETKNLFEEFLVNMNIDFFYAEKMDYDVTYLLQKYHKKNFNSFWPSYDEVNILLEKVRISGILTENRKEKISDLIFILRESIRSTGPGLNEIIQEVEKNKENKSKNCFYYCWSIVVAINIAICLSKYPSDFIETVVILFIFSSLLFILLYIPSKLIINSKCQKELRKKSIERFKIVYKLD